MGLSQLLVATASMAVLTPGLASGIHGPSAPPRGQNYCSTDGKSFDWVDGNGLPVGKPEPVEGHEFFCLACAKTDSVTTSNSVTKSSTLTSTVGVSTGIPNFMDLTASLGIGVGEAFSVSSAVTCNAGAIPMSLRFPVAIETFC